MSSPDPGYRPTDWDVAGDHEQRIARLEAVPPVVWVGDDCCLYWLCPADGLVYTMCGEVVPE